jgi:hypothetical protein
MASNDWGRDSDRVTRDITRVQIYKYVTKERVLDISDMLSLDTRRNKIAFTLVEVGDDYKAKTRVRHYVDVPDFKLVCWDILNGTFAEWTDHKGTQYEGGLQARAFTVRKDSKYKQPFVLKIDNGVGESLPSGAVKMVETTESLTVLLSEWDARRMAQTVLDYIRDWETVNFRKRQEAQTILIAVPDTGMGAHHHDAPVEEPSAEPEPAPRRKLAKAA